MQQQKLLRMMKVAMFSVMIATVVLTPCTILLILTHNTDAFTPTFQRYTLNHHSRNRIQNCNYHTLRHTCILQQSNYMYTGDKKVGFYIHIPYCRKRCRYCDFAIVPIGFAAEDDDDDVENNNHTNRKRKRDGFDKMNSEYTMALINEIDCLVDSFIRERIQSDEEYAVPMDNRIHLDSIYFGGGTPSLAPASTIEAILTRLLSSTIRTNEPIFYTTNQTEITMEMDPGTFTMQYLTQIKNMGVNRISLGVQSFDNDILSYIGRIHTIQDVDTSIQILHSVYGNQINYSIDLISGLPGLDQSKWEETLERAMDLKPLPPNHLSIYDLQIESGTVFGNWYDDATVDSSDVDEDRKQQRKRKRLEEQKGRSIDPFTTIIKNNDNILLSLPSPEDCANMYEYASTFLHSKGYEHYEISSYAKRKIDGNIERVNESSLSPNPNRSKHNQIYWEVGSEWYAIGLGATSCINRMRYSRPRTMSDYIEWTKNARTTISRGLTQPWLNGKESWEHDIEDIIMTRLRTRDGLDLTWVCNQENGNDIMKKILLGAKLGFELGLVKRYTRIEAGIDRLYLTDPKGFLFSNTIISSIFAEL